MLNKVIEIDKNVKKEYEFMYSLGALYAFTVTASEYINCSQRMRKLCVILLGNKSYFKMGYFKWLT